MKRADAKPPAKGLAPCRKRCFVPSALFRSAVLLGLLALLSAMLPSMPAFAHSIDYVATAISPAANFNGQSGNFTLINSIASGTDILFNLTFSINMQGSTTTYPRPVTFGVTTITKPAGAGNPLVTFGAPPNSTFQVTFTAHPQQPPHRSKSPLRRWRERIA